MVLTGVITIVLGIVMGALVWTPLYAIAAVAIVDFLLAQAFASGRIQAKAGVTATTDAAQDDDPSYNPYARED